MTRDALRTLVERIALRALLHGTGVNPQDFSAEQAREALLPLDHAHDGDVDVLLTLMESARADSIQRMRQSIHGAPGIDHEMIDEAIAFATRTTTGGWEPLSE